MTVYLRLAEVICCLFSSLLIVFNTRYSKTRVKINYFNEISGITYIKPFIYLAMIKGAVNLIAYRYNIIGTSYNYSS